MMMKTSTDATMIPPGNNNNHGASQKLELHEMAPHVILFRSKLMQPYDSCGSEGDAIIIYCQDTQVRYIVPAARLLTRKVLPRRRYHSEGQWNLC